MKRRYGLDDVHSQIAIARRMLSRNGLDGGVGGHVCVRVPGEDAFWMTPYQYFDETVPEFLKRSHLPAHVSTGHLR